MTFVVTDNCILCKYMDCGVCVPECPAEAIFPDTDSAATDAWLALNHKYSQVWPNITIKRTPPKNADAMNGVPDKLPSFNPEPDDGD